MSSRIAAIIACLRRATPYLAVELVLPGGSLVALTLWLLRNRKRLRRSMRRAPPGAGTARQLAAALGPAAASML